jgi:hypothetical protein
MGGDAMMRASRTPEIMGDAPYVIRTKPSREFTGQFYIDDDKLLHAPAECVISTAIASMPRSLWRPTSSCRRWRLRGDS